MNQRRATETLTIGSSDSAMALPVESTPPGRPRAWLICTGAMVAYLGDEFHGVLLGGNSGHRHRQGRACSATRNRHAASPPVLWPLGLGLAAGGCAHGACRHRQRGG